MAAHLSVIQFLKTLLLVPHAFLTLSQTIVSTQSFTVESKRDCRLRNHTKRRVKSHSWIPRTQKPDSNNAVRHKQTQVLAQLFKQLSVEQKLYKYTERQKTHFDRRLYERPTTKKKFKFQHLSWYLWYECINWVTVNKALRINKQLKRGSIYQRPGLVNNDIILRTKTNSCMCTYTYTTTRKEIRPI